jgi:hypothetical protein
MRLPIRVVLAATLCALSVLLVEPRANADARSDADARRAELLVREAVHPFPDSVCTRPVKASAPCISGELSQALALLYLDRSPQDLERGNELVADAVHRIPTLPGFGDADGLRHLYADEFHFGVGPQLYRIDALFGPGSGPFANRLALQSGRAAARVFYAWARTSCTLADADPTTVWDIYGSENHEAMANGTCWGAAEILSRDPAERDLRYADGSTPAQQLTAWSRFIETYIAERARRGMLVEFGSPSYAQGTLQNFYGYYDFARDPTLKRLAGEFLNLWWADWAQAELGGVQGGSKTRVYPVRAIDGNGAGDGPSYCYFGLAPLRGSPAPGAVMTLTSTFRPDPAVVDLAVQPRGAYVAEARAPGLARTIQWDRKRGGLFKMDAGDGIVRYTYVTDEFTMGTSLLTRLPLSAWAAISSQNRWNGVTLGSVPGAIVFALPKAAQKTYNAEWGVQDKATQIVQKIPAPLSAGTGPMQIFVARRLTREERGGWIFASNGSAYVALRPVRGQYAWETRDSRFADLTDDTAPVIVQAGDHGTYQTLAQFEAAVLNMPIRATADIVHVRGLYGARELQFFPGGGSLPRVNGREIDTHPLFTYRSPYMNEDWESGVVRISSARYGLTLDFRD